MPSAIQSLQKRIVTNGFQPPAMNTPTHPISRCTLKAINRPRITGAGMAAQIKKFRNLRSREGSYADPWCRAVVVGDEPRNAAHWAITGFWTFEWSADGRELTLSFQEKTKITRTFLWISSPQENPPFLILA